MHGCSTIPRTSNAVEGLAAAVGRALANYYCETWSHGKREGKAKKRKRKEAYVKRIFTISYFEHAWPKYRNKGILSLYRT